MQRRQLGHLHVIAELPTVELLVEPAATAMAVMRGFEVLDDRVILEDADGARHLTEPSVVARFTAALDALRNRAATGTQATALIKKIQQSLQNPTANSVVRAVLTPRASARTPPFRAHHSHNLSASPIDTAPFRPTHAYRHPRRPGEAWRSG